METTFFLFLYITFVFPYKKNLYKEIETTFCLFGMDCYLITLPN
jgi:hypothetical protein